MDKASYRVAFTQRVNGRVGEQCLLEMLFCKYSTQLKTNRKKGLTQSVSIT